MSNKRFRVAFSFAGEKRNFVEQVVAILAKRFGKDAILYDKYHEAEFARARLGRYLPKLYHNESDLVVVIICRDYGSKEWCGLEWDAIFDLLKNRRENEVMLARFDYATVEGLFSDAGFMELDHKTPEQTADLVLERLALVEGKPKTYYLNSKTSSRDLVYISYSHADKAWHEKLRRVLDADPIIRELVWDDTKIDPGVPFAKDIDDHVIRARIMIMLGSEDYFRPDSGAAQSETRPALTAHAKGEMDILWFPIKTFDYATSPVGHLMAATGTGAIPLERLSASDQKKSLQRVLHEVRRCLGIAASAPSAAKSKGTLPVSSSKQPPQPSVASTEPERVPKASGAIRKWQQKLDFLEEELAVAASAAQRFELKNQIAEAKAKIAELGG